MPFIQTADRRRSVHGINSAIRAFEDKHPSNKYFEYPVCSLMDKFTK
jgi:hypothetical protein